MFKRDSQRTPKQKAERAQMSIFARLAGCAYLIYMMTKILRTPTDQLPNPQISTLIAIGLIILSIVVIGFTISEFVKGLKSGRYKANTYEQAELANHLANREQQEDGNASSGTLDEAAQVPESSADEPED